MAKKTFCISDVRSTKEGHSFAVCEGEELRFVRDIGCWQEVESGKFLFGNYRYVREREPAISGSKSWGWQAKTNARLPRA
jgi:hypothetical protein